MRRNAPVLILTTLGFAAFAVFAVWAFREAGAMGEGWSGMAHIWPYVLGGLIAVAALTGGLMWLAFFSARRGYDDQQKPGDWD